MHLPFEKPTKHMIALLPHSIRKAEAVKDLEGPRLQAICLSIEDLCAPLIDYACLDS